MFPYDTRYLYFLRYSFALAVLRRNIFTRSHLAQILGEAYGALPVHCSTLENLGNFKALLDPGVRRVSGISKYRGFRVQMQGAACVVEVKSDMHSENWSGFSADGKEVGTGDGFRSHRLFWGSTLHIEGTPAYPFKKVEPHTIRMIEQRYFASHSRMGATFPGGEC